MIFRAKTAEELVAKEQAGATVAKEVLRKATGVTWNESRHNYSPGLNTLNTSYGESSYPGYWSGTMDDPNAMKAALEQILGNSEKKLGAETYGIVVEDQKVFVPAFMITNRAAENLRDAQINIERRL